MLTFENSQTSLRNTEVPTDFFFRSEVRKDVVQMMKFLNGQLFCCNFVVEIS